MYRCRHSFLGPPASSPPATFQKTFGNWRRKHLIPRRRNPPFSFFQNQVVMKHSLAKNEAFPVARSPLRGSYV